MLFVELCKVRKIFLTWICTVHKFTVVRLDPFGNDGQSGLHFLKFCSWGFWCRWTRICHEFLKIFNPRGAWVWKLKNLPPSSGKNKYGGNYRSSSRANYFRVKRIPRLYYYFTSQLYHMLLPSATCYVPSAPPPSSLPMMYVISWYSDI